MASTRACLVATLIIVSLVFHALEAAAARQLSEAPLTSIEVHTDPRSNLYSVATLVCFATGNQNLGFLVVNLDVCLLTLIAIVLSLRHTT
jgi:hypothetical protein